MKKLLLTLTVLTLLAGCAETTPVVETPMEEPEQKVMAPQPFYITGLTTEGDMVGGYEISIDPVEFFSSSDGTCRGPSPLIEGLPETEVCNPNGFLISNQSSEDSAGYMLSENVSVYVQNGATLLGMEYAGTEEGTLITFEQLVQAFEANPWFFEVTPFEFEFGTVMVDGIEMSDQVSAIKEIYIP